MIKPDMVRERLSLIQDAAAVLDRLAGAGLAEFCSDYRNPAAAESYLRRALEAVFDVGRHLLAAQGLVSLAAEYKSIARALGRQEVVDASLAQRLEMMAGYRNRLVHLYSEVAPAELHEVISRNTGDLRRFVSSVTAWLEART